MAAKRSTDVLIVNSSSTVLRFLKLLFLFLASSLFWNTLAMPYAKAQTSQAQTPASQPQATQPQTAPLPASQPPASQPQAAQPQVVQTQVSQAQTGGRKAKLNAPPEYPELARKLNIQGAARVLLTVSPDGKVGNVKELGGNPILVAALTQAVKKWKYEAADHESAIEVRFEFVQAR
jgi:TonB family protein